MLSEQIEKFRESGESFTSRDIVEATERVRERLITGWITSLSPDGEGRESIYRQLRGLDSILDELVAGWSKK
jgi:hypothetical protein